MTFLFDRVAAEPEFRANLPRLDHPEAAAALQDRLTALGDRIRAVLAEPKTAAQITAVQRGFRYPRYAYDLPRFSTFEPLSKRCARRASAWSIRAVATA